MMNNELPSFPKQSWGFNVSPKHSKVILTLPNETCFYISQAILGVSTGENNHSKEQSFVYLKQEGSDIILCSLAKKRCEMTNLSLDCEGPCEMQFYAEGPRRIYLTGHLYNPNASLANVITPPIIDNVEGIKSDTGLLGVADFVGEKAEERGCKSFTVNIVLPGLAEALKQIPIQLGAQVEATIKDVAEKSLRSQGIIQGDEDKNLLIADENVESNEGKKRRKRKRSKKHLLIADESAAGKSLNSGGEKGKEQKVENKLLPISAEIDGNNNEGEKSIKRKASNKHRPVVVIDVENYGSERGGKQKGGNKNCPIVADIDKNNNEGSSVRRKLDYVLPIKQIQPVDRHDKEGEKKRKKKHHSKLGVEADSNEGSTPKHETPEMLLFIKNSMEDKKAMKRKYRRFKQQEKRKLGIVIDENDQNRFVGDT